jgi:hypothetical protein
MAPFRICFGFRALSRIKPARQHRTRHDRRIFFTETPLILGRFAENSTINFQTHRINRLPLPTPRNGHAFWTFDRQKSLCKEYCHGVALEQTRLCSPEAPRMAKNAARNDYKIFLHNVSIFYLTQPPSRGTFT